MEKRPNLSRRAAIAVAFAASFAGAAAAADLTAAQIAERNAAARGGVEAWRAVKTMTLTGDMEAGGKQNTRLPFVLQLKRPLMSRLELKVRDQTALQTWDGRQGWKFRPFLNRDDVEAFTPAETQQAQSNDELDGPLIDYARKGSKLELLGTDKVAGKTAYRLRLTKASGEQRQVWVDASTFLDVKMDGEPRRMDGRVHKVAVLMSDFRKEGTVVVPHTLETVVEGVPQSHHMTIRSVALNAPMDNGLFAKPQASAANAQSRL